MSDNNRIRCKFCDWSTLRFFKTRGGKLNHGAYERLKMHMEDNHMDELDAIEQRLEKEYDDEENILDLLR